MLRRRRLAAGVKTGSAVQCESTKAQRGLGIMGRALGIGSEQGRADRQAGRQAGSCRVTTYLTYGTGLCVPHSTSSVLSAR